MEAERGLDKPDLHPGASDCGEEVGELTGTSAVQGQPLDPPDESPTSATKPDA